MTQAVITVITGAFALLLILPEKRKKKVGYAKLSFDESYVLSELLKVPSHTAWGFSIQAQLDKVYGDNAGGELRQLIKELKEQAEDCPQLMQTVLGQEAFEAVTNYKMVSYS
jgi:hypothetical protein